MNIINMTIGLGCLLVMIGCSPQESSIDKTNKSSSNRPAQNAFKLTSVDLELITIKKSEDKVIVDVNLGHGHRETLQAYWKQMTGTTLLEAELLSWAQKWDAHPRWRRIDVAIQLAKQAQVSPEFKYSDPWVEQPLLSTKPIQKNVKRDLGAVGMFFFNCPDGVNGKMSWANNHTPGMKTPAGICKIDEKDNGYYSPKNKGFWNMELMDAHYAGLQFLLLNTYGPDIEGNKLEPLREALKHIESSDLETPVKIGLFDDTWTWGKPYFGPHWKQIPDMEKPSECVDLIYESKWKPFFSGIPRQHWYLFEGKPLIYFYNAGTVENRHNGAEIFRLLKARFKQDFGVEPYLCVDSAFMKPGVKEVADQSFVWFSLGKAHADFTKSARGKTLSHAMVRWDSTSRSNKQIEREGNAQDRLYKNADLLKVFLDDTQNDDLAVIATWNDLGEGTGINRCYDYYWDGKFHSPTVFMNMVRASQAGETLLTATERDKLQTTEQKPPAH
jgi:hypothetical protein